MSTEDAPRLADVTEHQRLPQHDILNSLVGKWITVGETIPSDGEQALKIHASDIYEWVAGRFFVVTRTWIGPDILPPLASAVDAFVGHGSETGLSSQDAVARRRCRLRTRARKARSANLFVSDAVRDGDCFGAHREWCRLLSCQPR